jgi:hypothetical protein
MRDRATRVLDDLTGDRSHQQPGESARTARAQTIMSASAPSQQSRPGRSPGTLVLTPGRANCLELT